MRRTVSLIYKILAILSLSTGIFLNVINTTSVQTILSYYTLQSNIICLIAFVIFAIMEMRQKYYKTDIYYLIKGAIIIAILITAITYRCALAPVGFEMESLQKSIANKEFANLLVHTISPILVVMDYFLFDKKGHFKYFYSIIWLVIPLNYIVYVYTYGARGGEFFSIGGSKKFAYFFLDYEKIGYSGVAKWIAFMTVCILFLSIVLIFIDRRMRDKFEP